MKDGVLHDEVRVALRAAADENLVAPFGLAVRHYGWPPAGIRRFGGVVAVAVGLPAAFYNRCGCVPKCEGRWHLRGRHRR